MLGATRRRGNLLTGTPRPQPRRPFPLWTLAATPCPASLPTLLIRTLSPMPTMHVYILSRCHFTTWERSSGPRPGDLRPSDVGRSCAKSSRIRLRRSGTTTWAGGLLRFWMLTRSVYIYHIVEFAKIRFTTIDIARFLEEG